MSQNLIQNSFSAGELAPSLLARTDLAKYHSGAQTMRNFFVDYRSGASTRPGTRLVVPAYLSGFRVRIIRFQSSVLVPYILEFGQNYLRVISNGAPVVETSFAITSVGPAWPATVQAPGNNYEVGDVVFIGNTVGVPQLVNRFAIVAGVTGAQVSLNDIFGRPINGLQYGTHVGGGTIARVYKTASPYAAADLDLLKFVQLTNTMYLTHPNYPPYILTLNTPTNWTFTQITFGATVQPPTNVAGSASSSGTANYSYVVTSVDANNQESQASAQAAVASAVNITTAAGTITVTWTAAPGAVV